MRKEFISEPEDSNANEPFYSGNLDHINVESLSQDDKFTLFNHILDKIKKQLTKSEKRMLKKVVQENKEKGMPRANGFELFAICNYWAEKHGFHWVKSPEEFIKLALSHLELLEG